MTRDTKLFSCRQIEKYDGQTLYCQGGEVAYELGNYLGGGASGSVYQAVDMLTNARDSSASPNSSILATDTSTEEKSVAIKILNPVGFKNLPYSQIAKCIPAWKGLPLNPEQIQGKAPMSHENVWWLVHSQTRQIYAGYEDPNRGQIRELPLPKCIEVWGLDLVSLSKDKDKEGEVLSDSEEKGRIITSSNSSNSNTTCENAKVPKSILIGGSKVQIPEVAPKYLKWLQTRQSVCREMYNMQQVGEHENIIELLEVMELVQDSKSTLFLVLEMVNGGELFDRMKMSGLGPPDEFARRYFIQLLSGIQYCHEKGVVHRDLKPENLLLSDPSEGAILKIADFGLSAVTQAETSSSLQEGAYVMDGDRGQSDLYPVSSAIVINQNRTTNIGNTNTSSPPLGPAISVSVGTPSSPLPLSAPSPVSVSASVSMSEKGSSSDNTSDNTCNSNSNSNDTPSPGLTAPVTPVPLRRLKSVVGSPHYIAPEVTSSGPVGYDGSAVDMWSSGIILYSLLTGNLPFGSDISCCPRFRRYRSWLANDYAKAIQAGVTPELPIWFIPASVSKGAASLILSLLQVNPQERISIKMARAHPWCIGENGFSDAGDVFATILLQQSLHSAQTQNMNMSQNQNQSIYQSASQGSVGDAIIGSSSLHTTAPVNPNAINSVPPVSSVTSLASPLVIPLHTSDSMGSSGSGVSGGSRGSNSVGSGSGSGSGGSYTYDRGEYAESRQHEMELMEVLGESGADVFEAAFEQVSNKQKQNKYSSSHSKDKKQSKDRDRDRDRKGGDKPGKERAPLAPRRAGRGGPNHHQQQDRDREKVRAEEASAREKELDYLANQHKFR